ncbi:MAG: ABC transporter ATP-binding protein [Flavobacteriaceae bacterium]
MILSLKEISKSFGSRQVLNSVSLNCSSGEICGLIGPNGAGKSTLFRIVLGLVTPDSGSIEINSKAPKPLGGIIDKPALYGYLSARDNIKVFARLQGLHFSTDVFVKLMEEVGLFTDRNDPVKNYSMGMKQRLGLAIALMNRPECIILDEPFSGLDPMGIQALHGLLRKLALENNMAVMLSSHNLTEIADLCDTLYVINEGMIVKKDKTKEIIGRTSIAYILYGNPLEKSRILQKLSAEIRGDSVLVEPGEFGIERLIDELVAEGISISACLPQPNLTGLFENDTA